MRDRVRRAGLHTVAAENAARVVDVIDLGVAVPGGNAIRLRVFCGFDVYAIRRTGCSAQETPHTFFVPIFVALQHVNSPVARLDAGRNVRVRLRRRLAEHGQKSDAEAFNERDECFANLVHQEGAPTHGDWFSATSVGNLMKALNALMAQGAAAGPDKSLNESRHWDYLLVSRQYGKHSGTFENSYLRVSSYKTKHGEGETVEKALNSYIIPRLEKLLADGAIHYYAVSREAIHTDDPAEFDIVVITNGAAGLDKFYESLEAAAKANPTGGPAFASANEGSAHRDFLSLATAVFK